MGYLTGEAIGSVRDNGLLSVAAVSTVSISLLVLALVALLALNLQYLVHTVDGEVQVVAYLGPAAAGAGGAAQVPPASASAAAAVPPETEVLQEIRAVPGVTSAVLVSKGQALAKLEQNLDTNLSEFAKQNPLPDSVDVSVARPQDIGAVAAAVSALPGVSQVQDAQTTVDKLVAFTRAVRILGIFLVAALALATIVVIGNTVRVAVWARRDQIAIQKLVGATNGFIRWPFFIEGAILGLLGAAVSGAVVAWGYVWVQRAVARSLAFLPLLRPQVLVPGLIEVLLCGGLVLGALGSAVSVHRHLDV
jgi:cell division transport system permease protein